MNFDKVLTKYRAESLNEREKGDKFERLIKRFLQTDRTYSDLFNKVYLWSEFPFRSDFGGTDTGIDLVAETYAGDYWAIQCKCYAEDTRMEKAHVDSYITTSSRSFMNEDYETRNFGGRLWVATTNHWGRNAEEAIKNQSPPVSRIGLSYLREAALDWEKLDNEVHGAKARTAGKSVRDHQRDAIRIAHNYFEEHDRGKLIMACGTGKTFTSLRIAENETGGRGFILFLVPSISLLGQTLREWTADATEPINAICICSDAEVSKKKSKSDDSDSFSVIDLALPASTDVRNIKKQVQLARDKQKSGLTVVFSTYQSIDVISRAQKELESLGYGEFDLIICDEAHRTTGVKLEGEDESAFVKVHDNEFIRAKKRLYMTATPRLYTDDAKAKATLADAAVWSMDNPAHFGEEIYRIGFGEAVERNLLTDYKVLVLTLSEEDVPPAVQKALQDVEGKIEADDVTKLIGTINGLSKQFIGDQGQAKAFDPGLMKRAVAFCPSIKASKTITNIYNAGTEAYIRSLPKVKQDDMAAVTARHIDGTYGALERDKLLGWLKQEPRPGECRVLTNVRCLSEGVDVPSLDAVMFLSARNSQVDVVQSVGRVMRVSEGKKCGYIIIPVIVPSDIEPEKALDVNERYKVVWTVLNALRAHDDRFNATINQIDLNRKRPDSIIIGAPEVTFDKGQPTLRGEQDATEAAKKMSSQLRLQFEQLQGAIFARIVKKVGNRLYWEQWAATVGEIAARQIARIERLIADDGPQRQAFDDFVAGLRKNINPSITSQEAVEMLSQHIITRPVFEALFEGYSFVEHNPISVSMQSMLEALQGTQAGDDDATLQKFFDFVRRTVKGLDNAEAKQGVILRLYDNFFKIAFPKMVERLGIVYTPVEVVDFIIHSVNDVLRQEFGRELRDRDVHILDPFTGTGTFITRLLQTGLIAGPNLEYKYRNEIFANEIVLLAYYIAAVNIENSYHDTAEITEYLPFLGICLTDTFQLSETGAQEALPGEAFRQNSDRVERQKRAPLTVIFGNPPYSVGQRTANDNAQNQRYQKLDRDIARTYAALTQTTNKNSLYDSYIKAFRWSTDRLGGDGGIICFVSNGSWIDGNAQDGFRKSLQREFSKVYVLNLRGNARTSGETRKKEAGNVFGSGSRTPIAITLLIKKPTTADEMCTIRYVDIGDYLNQKEKLLEIQRFQSVANDAVSWTRVTPNDSGDWIAQRNATFSDFVELGNKNDSNQLTFFGNRYSHGIKTNRDPWLYNFQRQSVVNNASGTIDFFNLQSDEFAEAVRIDPKTEVENFVNNDPKKISWSRALRHGIAQNRQLTFNASEIRQAAYRPFMKQYVYFSRDLINDTAKICSFFPEANRDNLFICVPGAGAATGFGVIIADRIPDLHLNGDSQCFPLHYYEINSSKSKTLFDCPHEPDYFKCDGITDLIHRRACEQYGDRVKKEDIFYYVYGFLHSPEYRKKFANDLKKMLPRIPLVDSRADFVAFSKAGRALADLHLNYEKVRPLKEVKVTGDERDVFTVEKMRFPKKGERDTIIYNSEIIVSRIPEKAYEYVINGKSAIEWIMERYVDKTDKASGIRNNANDWAVESGNPRYILDLLLSIINVSVQTVDIVAGLPKVEFS